MKKYGDYVLRVKSIYESFENRRILKDFLKFLTGSGSISKDLTALRVSPSKLQPDTDLQPLRPSDSAIPREGCKKTVSRLLCNFSNNG